MYRLDYYGGTETGRRPQNEDSFLIYTNHYGYLVSVIADGMGGHKGGQMASKTVIKMVKKAFKSIDFGKLSVSETKEFLLNKVREFQKDLKRIGEEFPDYSDMGSTMNLNIFVKDILFTVNVGDTRAQSFIKKDLVGISIDQNLGTLAEKDERYAMYKGQMNMLTSSLGPNKTTKADLFVTKLEAKKGYITISTDGVHNFISEISWIKILKSSKTLSTKVEQTIQTAYDNGSNDNMTFIIIKYER